MNLFDLVMQFPCTKLPIPKKSDTCGDYFEKLKKNYLAIERRLLSSITGSFDKLSFFRQYSTEPSVSKYIEEMSYDTDRMYLTLFFVLRIIKYCHDNQNVLLIEANDNTWSLKYMESNYVDMVRDVTEARVRSLVSSVCNGR